MAIKYVERPFTITTTSGSSSSLTEEAGSTADNRIIALRTITDDGAGGFLNGL